jgi:class 3 adenylate cyclase
VTDTDGLVDPHGNDAGAQAQIRTFLIADVRGYTLFTQERGDEAAAKFAARFAELAREIVESRGGTLLELRGDEALCVFAPTREAIRSAIDTCVTHEAPATFGPLQGSITEMDTPLRLVGESPGTPTERVRAQPIDEAVYRSWAGGGLATGWNVH